MKTLIFDLDGTMYRGTSIIETAKQFLDVCIERNIPYVFLTNNSTRTQIQNAQHMWDMGYQGIRPEMFFNSAMASCAYVADHYSQRKASYLGEEGMRQALLDYGFTITEEDPDFVFIGLKKEATYQEYAGPLNHLLKGAKLIGTNMDRVFPNPTGFSVGNGSIVTMFEYASNQKSPNIGKPNEPILTYCLKHFGLQKEDVILIGDNLETDIALGANHGVQTVFVQGGVHSKEDIDRLHIQPDIVVDTLMDCCDLEFMK